ncbi:MAG: hypothetical protein CL526_07795 [Aequorivita sp.]|nr:hypothetical protein [Aequorivita sp.]|tara:strand:- start:22848 stop:23603 length:756 start_codon:yes stop_codon:yes gene_type:complete
MAKQKGIVKLKGTIGDFTFYKSGDGYLAREKGGIEKNRILNDPAFKRTRENGMEFGTAGKSGQLIRKGERLLLRQASDNRVTSRLVQVLMSIIKTDSLNKRGSRTVQDGNMALLKGFDFNLKGKLDTVFFSGYSLAFDRAAGSLDVTIAEFIPNETIDAPRGTTHIQLVGGVCALDFVNKSFEEDHAFSTIIPWDMTLQAPITLSSTISPATTVPVIQVVGVNFFQEVNGEMYPLRNGAFNALAIVEVDQL